VNDQETEKSALCAKVGAMRKEKNIIHSAKGVFAIIIIIIIITGCKIWIRVETTQFKYLVCLSCNSPDDGLQQQPPIAASLWNRI
jgi:hypothetical protein